MLTDILLLIWLTALTTWVLYRDHWITKALVSCATAMQELHDKVLGITKLVLIIGAFYLASTVSTAHAESPYWLSIKDYRLREAARKDWLREVRYTRAVQKSSDRRARIRATRHLTHSYVHYSINRRYYR